MGKRNPARQNRRLAALVVSVLCVWVSGEAPRAALEGEEDIPKEAYAGSTEVTVSAQPIAESLESTPQGTTVAKVSEGQMEDLNAQDLTGALRRIPGLTISRYNPVGSYGGADGGAVYIRGQGAGRPGGEVATLVDGVPVVVSVWTHPILDLLNTDAAESIQVYKSPEPVLFGNMAFGAVNLIPKRPSEAANGKAVVFGGSNSQFGVKAEEGVPVGRGGLYLQVSLLRSDGHREDAGGRVARAYGRAEVEIADHWDLSLQAHHTDSWAEDPGRQEAPKPPVTPRYPIRNTLLLATLENRFPWGDGHVKVYDNDGLARWRQWDTGAGHAFVTRTEYEGYGVRIRQNFTPWAGGRITVGMDDDVFGGHFRELRPYPTRPGLRRLFRNRAPYLLLSQTFGEALRVTPSFGIRVNDARCFEDQTGRQFGFTAAWEGIVLHAGRSRSFNYPGVYAAVMFGPSYPDRKWTGLKAETLTHAELGAGYDAGGPVSADLTLFSDEVENALRFAPPPPFPPGFVNIGAYSVKGAMGEMRLAPSPRVAVFLGGCTTSTGRAEVPETPKWTLSGGVTALTAGGIRISGDAQYVGGRNVLNPRFARRQERSGAYFLLNARIAKCLWEAGSGASGEIYVAGENLLDREYSFRPGYPMAGINGSVGLTLRW
ncbi:MAG: TonB-dependent receptor plug domain-containing protein [Acidobacteriota bacterium]